MPRGRAEGKERTLEVGFEPTRGSSPMALGLRYLFSIPFSMASIKEREPITVYPKGRMNLSEFPDFYNDRET